MQIIVSFNPIHLWQVEDPSRIDSLVAVGFDDWEEAVHFVISSPRFSQFDLDIQVEEEEVSL
jgi:hypothetical protein